MKKVSKIQRPAAQGRLRITLSKQGATIVANDGVAILAALALVAAVVVIALIVLL